MTDELCPPWVPSAPPSPQLEGGEDPFLDLPFLQDELEYAVANIKLSSSLGPDRIDYRMISHLLDLPFLQEELEYAVANLKISSSLGPDSIDYKMISHLPGRGRTIILELFN
jgi:hypothetical protein